jgi:cell division protein FtsX
LDDEVFYEAVADELQSGNLRKGLWTKALTRALNDQTLARVYYIEVRVEQLKQQDAARRQQAQQEQAVRRQREADARDVEYQRLGCRIIGWIVAAGIVLQLLVYLSTR